MTRPDLVLARELDAALAWWQAAGVTHDFADDATAWLADLPDESADGAVAGRSAGSQAARSGASGQKQADAAIPGRAPSQPAAAATARRNYLGDSPPGDLAAFRDWWMTAADLGSASSFARIAPRGQPQPALMVIVPCPEPGDTDTLLAGAQGRLLGNIIAAMGLDDNAVYCAAALPCHTPMADLIALAAGGMDAVTAHHIQLVRPARVLAFGSALAPMLGAQDVQSLREINHASGNIPVMSCETLDALMDMPRLKARFWRRWMEWSAIN